MADEWDLHAIKVDRICELAITDLLKALRVNPGMTRGQLASVILAINEQYGALAAQDAADTMVNERAARGLTNLPTPDLQTVVSEEMADALAGWAQAGDSPQDASKRAAAGMNRTIRNASRQTVWEGVRSAQTRWARIPRVGACAFCLMLASRGAVYYWDTVTKTKSGQRYHDSCHCQGREILDDSQVPEIVTQLQAKWRTTKAAVGEVWRDGQRHLSLDQWLETIQDEREADRQARNLVQRLTELDEGIAVDPAKLWKHVAVADQGGRRGGHLASSAQALADEITASREPVIKAPKTFFPDVPDDVLHEWLGDDTHGAIRAVLDDPVERVWLGPRAGFQIAGDVDGPEGGRIRLTVIVNRAPRSSSTRWRVVTAYPDSGDGVVMVTPSGEVRDVPLADNGDRIDS